MEFSNIGLKKKIERGVPKTSELTCRPELSDNHQGLNKHNHKYVPTSFCARDTKYSQFSKCNVLFDQRGLQIHALTIIVFYITLLTTTRFIYHIIKYFQM